MDRVKRFMFCFAKLIINVMALGDEHGAMLNLMFLLH